MHALCCGSTTPLTCEILLLETAGAAAAAAMYNEQLCCCLHTHMDCSAPSVAPGDARASCTTMESATTSANAVDRAAVVMKHKAVGTELARAAIHSHATQPVTVDTVQRQRGGACNVQTIRSGDVAPWV